MLCTYCDFSYLYFLKLKLTQYENSDQANIVVDLQGHSRLYLIGLSDGPIQLQYSNPPLIGTLLSPNNSVLIREVSFGKRED